MQFLKNLLVTAIVNVIMFCSLIAIPAHASEVIATGTGSTFESALHDSMRTAIERSIGAFVSSRTLTLNHQVLTDEILVKSGGFIESYDILRQEQYAGIFEVEAKFKIRSEELQSSVMSLLEKKSIVEANLNDPRIVIIALDDNGTRYPEVESEVASALNNAGFSRIVTNANSSDYVISIHVRTTLTQSKTYSSTLAVKMTATSTGEAVYSGTFRGSSRMFTNNSASGALEFASRNAARAIATAALNRAAALEQHITIHVSQTTLDNFGSVENLKSRLKSITGVNNVFVRRINNSATNPQGNYAVELDVNFDGTASELASLLNHAGCIIKSMFSSSISI